VLNLHTAQVFNVERDQVPRGGTIDTPQNTAVRSIQADILVERLENGELDGKLKQIAETIDEEDNPVVEIIKFR